MKDMFSVEKKMMPWSKSSKKFAAKKDGFSPKHFGVSHGSCNSSATRAWLPFPWRAGVPATDPVLHLQGWHCTVKSPSQLIKKNLGYKKNPCRIASRRHGRAILNKNTFHFCISTKK